MCCLLSDRLLGSCATGRGLLPSTQPPRGRPARRAAAGPHPRNQRQREEKSDKRIKLSTVVDPGTLDAFYLRYAELCKAGIVALKPRDRSKKKAKARKKKGGPAPTGVS